MLEKVRSASVLSSSGDDCRVSEHALTSLTPRLERLSCPCGTLQGVHEYSLICDGRSAIDGIESVALKSRKLFDRTLCPKLAELVAEIVLQDHSSLLSKQMPPKGK